MKFFGNRTFHQLSLILFGFLFSLSGHAAIVTGSVDIFDERFTPQYGNSNLKDHNGNSGPFGPFHWIIDYNKSFDGKRILNTVPLNFQFEDSLGYTDSQQAAYIAAAERVIEMIWSNRFYILDIDNSAIYPIVVDIRKSGSLFDRTVFVQKGAGGESVYRWFETTNSLIMAHEFGHMLGLFDEYIGGAVDRYPNPTLSADGLMGLGALRGRPKMYSRYFQSDLSFVQRLNPDSRFALQAAVPEPSSTILVIVGSLALCILRRRTGGRTCSSRWYKS